MDRFRLDSFRFWRVTLSLCVVAVRSSLTAALDKYVALESVSICTVAHVWFCHTFRASFREKLLSQWVQGKGLTAKWIRLCLFKSWFRLKLWGH